MDVHLSAPFFMKALLIDEFLKMSSAVKSSVLCLLVVPEMQLLWASFKSPWATEKTALGEHKGSVL